MKYSNPKQAWVSYSEEESCAHMDPMARTYPKQRHRRVRRGFSVAGTAWGCNADIEVPGNLQGKGMSFSIVLPEILRDGAL
jgi:hypothetical protein